MNVSANHLPEELLERYALGRMSDHENARIEEHLLICQVCRTQLEQMDEFVTLMKFALADSSDTEPEIKSRHMCVKTA